jgi:cytoplasmic tRNA 2-thiolation protein 1
MKELLVFKYKINIFKPTLILSCLGYRDDSLETVKRNEIEYELPLKILSYKELYGWTMDEIVREIGRKNNCTFCGVFRRQALDRGAVLLGVNKIVTGHNADDVAETILMNLLRGDVARLQRCTAITTVSFKKLEIKL